MHLNSRLISRSFFPQTQQGADLIASTLKTTVYMPDFFEPKVVHRHDLLLEITDVATGTFPNL